ncbi:MAG TPA: hypothetical protein VGO11_15335 [Chthoniobacteraceae bacterium]|jgi:predicted nucleic acid-binding protein|nr:hypothetical protein [Chthoniobacteraceae bacterium]
MSGPLVVSDSSPLHYLILIEATDLLPRVASEVLVPPAVVRELAHAETPAEVRRWMRSPPGWLRVVAPSQVDASLDLDPGEMEAISLALELRVASILLDEKKGRRIAKERGLRPIGLLAVLEYSASNGWIDFEDAVARLQITTFRMSKMVLVEIRQRLAQRRP